MLQSAPRRKLRISLVDLLFGNSQDDSLGESGQRLTQVRELQKQVSGRRKRQATAAKRSVPNRQRQCIVGPATALRDHSKIPVCSGSRPLCDPKKGHLHACFLWRHRLEIWGSFTALDCPLLYIFGSIENA
eukprot:scaffold3818_cov327-Pinguiococcus_pyrenoidosus.AAC.1